MNNPYRRPFRDRLVLAKILQTDFQDPTNGINAFGRVGRELVQKSIKKLPSARRFFAALEKDKAQEKRK